VKKEIRVLCVEDVCADAVMLNHALRKGKFTYRSKRVDTKEAFVRELEDDPPDLILSDHGLASFDGFAALAIARVRYPEMPFIFVTGCLSEEKTIEMFQAGASDYVLKSDLSKLAPAVERALCESGERGKLRLKERELRESEERYRLLVERSPDAIFVIRPDGQIAFANPTASRLVGAASVAELVGKPAKNFFRTDPWAALASQAAQPLAAQSFSPSVEQKMLRLDGAERDVEVSAASTIFEGAPAVQVISHDISERKQAAERLRQSESLKSAILETALDAIMSVDHEGKIQEWNPAAERIFGYSRAKAIGQSMDDLIIPAVMRDVYKEGLTSYLMTGAGSLVGRPIELTLRRQDGSEFRAELAISRVLTEEPPRCTALIRDISERKQAEARLRESEERLRLLVSSVKDYAIYMLDPHGRVATWNAGAQLMFGFRSAEIMGKHFSTFFTREDIERGVPERVVNKATRTGHADYEGWRLRKDGSRFWVEGIMTAMRDEGGQLYGFSKIARDTTHQRDTAEEIRRLNEDLEHRVRERTAQLEAANRELEAFSYSISHDLRAPLRHIAGYVDILKNETAGKLDDSARQHLQTIAMSANNLGNLIDALLEFSRMGRAELRRRPVRLAALVEQAHEELRTEIAGRDIDWRIGVLAEVHGDPLMLRQVMINLISNALKYTRTRKQARIEIGATTSDRDITFFIRDNGVGFDMKYADKLFGVFQRLHGASDFEGVGIGLANVQRIIQRHGGRVWAQAAVDNGTTFFVSIPKQPRGRL
jgi:PAS domain S-box-containing protein